MVRTYRLVLNVEPTNHTARLKVARALRLLERNQEAIDEYSALAHYLAREGDLFGAISACKSILDLDPSHQETQLNLARLYALTPVSDEYARVVTPLDASRLLSPAPAQSPVRQLPPAPAAPAPGGARPGGVRGLYIDAPAVAAPTGWNDPINPSTVELEIEDLDVVSELRTPTPRPALAAAWDAADEEFTGLVRTISGVGAHTLAGDDEPVRGGTVDDALPPVGGGDTTANPSAVAEAAVDRLLTGAQRTISSLGDGNEDPTVVARMTGPDTDQGPSLASALAAGLEAPQRPAEGRGATRTARTPLSGGPGGAARTPAPPSANAVTMGSLPAIELRDADFEVIDREPDSADVIDTARLTEGWDRIADSLARETDQTLLHVSDKRARATPRPATPPPLGEPGGRAGGGPVPEIPLFSSLTRDAFIRLVERMGRRRLAPGEVLVQSGFGADALHVVARGLLRATRDGDDGRPVLLAKLGPGDFLGEFTFLTGVPSPATISAELESEVLRISNEVMRSVVAEHPEVATVLWRFFVDRMTHSLLATSSLFQGLPQDRQLDIGRRFKPVEVRSGTTVIREGEPAAGLYLVVSGGVDVLVGKGEQKRRVASLAPGEFFGVRTAALGALPVVRVVSTQDSMLLLLPVPDFREILDRDPSVRVAVETVSGMRRLLTNALFQGQTSYAADGLLHF